MLVSWNQDVEVKQFLGNDFCMKLRIVYELEGAKFLAIFVHASADAKEMQQQWELSNGGCKCGDHSG